MSEDELSPYTAERTPIVRGIACTESILVEVLDDIPVTKLDGRRDEHVGRFVFAKYPLTTAQVLAIAVLKGEPCGRELVDCLIESGTIVPDGEVVPRLVKSAFDAFERKRWKDRKADPIGHCWHENFDEIKAEVLAFLANEND